MTAERDGGTLVAAVRELVEDSPNTPAPLAAAVTLLAEQLERNPTSTPMWGRFLQALEGLLDAWARSRPDDDEARQLSHFIRTGCEDPSHVGPVHCSSCCRRRFL